MAALVRATQVTGETLTEITTAAAVRETQAGAEVLVEAPGTAKVRETQIAAEVLVEAAHASVFLTQAVTEVLVEILGAARVRPTQVVVEVLVEDTLGLPVEVPFEVTDEERAEFILSTVAAVSTTGGISQAFIEAAVLGQLEGDTQGLVVTQALVEWALNPVKTDFFVGNAVHASQSCVEWALWPDNQLMVTQACIEVAYKFTRVPPPHSTDVIAKYKRAITNR